nr:C2 calcium/lipid-binding domain, CaLB [Tanacetum cinerariifolium]
MTNCYGVEIPGLASILRELNKEDDLEQQMTHGSDVDVEYHPSNIEFIEWLDSKFYNHKTMDQYTKNALWIYWTRGNDEVEITDEESSDSDADGDDEVVEIFRIDTNVSLLKILIDLKPTKNIRMIGYMSGIKTYRGWKFDGYCNGWNLTGAYIVGNILRYQGLEWYEALEDGKLEDEALKNKAIMEGMIDDDDESHNNDWKR